MEILKPNQLYTPDKPFNTDDWVAMRNYRKEPGLWRTTKGYIRIVDMETDHLPMTISFVERRDPNYKQSKVWLELVTEYHKRERKPAPADKEGNRAKRKFRLSEE